MGGTPVFDVFIMYDAIQVFLQQHAPVQYGWSRLKCS